MYTTIIRNNLSNFQQYLPHFQTGMTCALGGGTLSLISLYALKNFLEDANSDSLTFGIVLGAAAIGAGISWAGARTAIRGFGEVTGETGRTIAASVEAITQSAPGVETVTQALTSFSACCTSTLFGLLHTSSHQSGDSENQLTVNDAAFTHSLQAV